MTAVYYVIFDIIKEFLKHPDLNVNTKGIISINNTSIWLSPLEAAIYFGSTDIVQLLLTHDKIVLEFRRDKQGYAFQNAIDKNKIKLFHILLRHDKFDINMITGIYNSTLRVPLVVYSCIMGKWEITRLLLKQKDIKVESVTDNYRSTNSMLNIISENYDKECLKIILSREDINLNYLDEFGRSPLVNAARFNNTEMIRLLLSDIRCDIEFVYDVSESVNYNKVLKRIK